MVPNIKLDINKVNAGAVLFTVSVKLTSTYFRAYSPKNAVAYLRPPIRIMYFEHKGFLDLAGSTVYNPNECFC